MNCFRIAQLPLDDRGDTKPSLVPVLEIYSSQPNIYCQDVAIARDNDNLRLDQGIDLKGYNVASWQSAANDLGREFASLLIANGDYKKPFNK